jgi:hypothetical protein
MTSFTTRVRYARVLEDNNRPDPVLHDTRRRQIDLAGSHPRATARSGGVELMRGRSEDLGSIRRSRCWWRLLTSTAAPRR